VYYLRPKIHDYIKQGPFQPQLCVSNEGTDKTVYTWNSPSWYANFSPYTNSWTFKFQSPSCPGDRMSSPELSQGGVEMTNTSSTSTTTRRSTRVAKSEEIETTEIDNSAGQLILNEIAIFYLAYPVLGNEHWLSDIVSSLKPFTPGFGLYMSLDRDSWTLFLNHVKFSLVSLY